MAQLLQVRSAVLGLLEQARGKRRVDCILFWSINDLKVDRQLSSSTEAEVDMILPRVDSDLAGLIAREGTFTPLSGTSISTV